MGFGWLRRHIVIRRRGTIHLGFLVTEGLGCFSFLGGKLRGTFQIFLSRKRVDGIPTRPVWLKPHNRKKCQVP
jgi:hypothetical protein